MGANDAVHDEVAAKIAAHHAAILADLSKPRRRKTNSGNARPKRKVGIPGTQSLFGGLADTRSESFGQTRNRLATNPSIPVVARPMVRRREIRCTDCDHTLVVRTERVICPSCGAIFGSVVDLRPVFDAFPGATFTEDDPAS